MKFLEWWETTNITHNKDFKVVAEAAWCAAIQRNVNKEIDFIRLLLNDKNNQAARFWQDGEIAEALVQTKIFHILMAIKILKIKDGQDWQIPKFDELNNLLTELLKPTKKEGK